MVAHPSRRANDNDEFPKRGCAAT